MLRWIYLYRNLTRNVTRTVLTCAAVGLPIMIFVLSTAALSILGYEHNLEEPAIRLRNDNRHVLGERLEAL